jgi:hypothetical protein
MLCALLAACSRAGSETDSRVDAAVLEYTEQEAGTDPYPVRILATKEYLRIDDGYDRSDYILLDRRARKVFSILHGDRSILLIDPPAVEAGSVPDVDPGIDYLEDESAPLIAGKRPRHYRFTAGGEICREAVVVPQLLPAAVQALIEYDRLLARQHRNNLDQVPAEIRTPCYLSRYVYHPARPLEQGLPIREWDDSGYLRTLIDYRGQVQVSPDLFAVPIGYEQHTLGR